MTIRPRGQEPTGSEQVRTPPLIGEVQTELPAQALAEGLPSPAMADDREQVEAELRRLSAIVRNASDAVIIQTSDGEIIAWNHGAELMYGYPEEEAVGMNARLLIPPALRPGAEGTVPTRVLGRDSGFARDQAGHQGWEYGQYLVNGDGPR